MRHSAGDASLQVVPALRGDDGVDGTTLRFLLEQNLLLKKKQEEEEKVKERAKKVAESEVQQQAATTLEQARLLLERNKRRKRKKRRKKRTPRTSSLPGRATGAVLGQGFLHRRCCATSGVLVQTVLYTVWRFRSCSSSRSSISCCGTEAYPHGLAVQQTIEFVQLLRYMWSTSLLYRLCSFPGGLQFLDTPMTCPLLLTTGAWSWTVSNCRGSAVAVL